MAPSRSAWADLLSVRNLPVAASKRIELCHGVLMVLSSSKEMELLGPSFCRVKEILY